jgi:hypothetical protein
MKKAIPAALVVLMACSVSVIAGTAQTVFQRAPTWVYAYFPIDLPGARHTYVSGINNHGDIAGSFEDPGTSLYGFVTSNGVITTLSFPVVGPFGGVGYTPTTALDLNDSGAVVGSAGYIPASPFGWRYANGAYSYTAGSGGDNVMAFATGVNNGGHVVGWVYTAFRFAPGVFRLYSYIDSQTFDNVYLEGNNDAGHVVGRGTFPDGTFAPFLQVGAATIRIVLPFPSATEAATQPRDVNNHDTVVGQYTETREDDGPERWHGFVWSAGKAARIDYPDAFSTSVEGINDAGVIVGSYNNGFAEDFRGHGFVAVPRSPVTLTANGAPGPATILRTQPLRIDLAFKAPPDGPLNPAELYVGVVAPFGVLWLTPSGALASTPARVFAGSLPTFGAVPVIQLATASGLVPGNYTWFAIVDDDTNGVPNGSFYDVAQVTIR